ncbi:GAF domain-containing sensor histidine kinase [Rufibacter ruber]|uniref:GAF domain-containing sensor histidine kinase n=1 Tax=Rufibacter ruber TaxID=1783499 RepID=UPI000833B1F6|nr:GAF domain-containing sensor histidine kinase [Rufibacter ruber]
MILPAIPENEIERLEALYLYDLLDTLPEQDFDELTKIATVICQTPVSLITLVDAKRQWFKSAQGLEVRETPRELAFCAHAINNAQGPFVVTDATKDERFYDNPLVAEDPKIVFYAGVVLNTPEGLPLGTICVIDTKARELTQDQIKALEALANQVMGQMELRRKNRRLELLNREISILNRNLSEFSYRVSHDLKTPLRGINALSGWLLEEYREKLDEQGVEYLTLINKRSNQLHHLTEGILQYSKATTIQVHQKEEVDLTLLIQEVLDHCEPPAHFTIHYPTDHPRPSCFRLGLYQILQNLVTNAIKYNDKPQGEIQIDYIPAEAGFHLSVGDNGPGIPVEFREKVFLLFETLGSKSNLKEGSVGVGLATAKSLTERMGGTIQICDRGGQPSGVCFQMFFPG